MHDISHVIIFVTNMMPQGMRAEKYDSKEMKLQYRYATNNDAPMCILTFIVEACFYQENYDIQ